MISFDDTQVYLACGATDMRKQINGLSTLVVSAFELDPFKPVLFAFCNKRKNRLKILCFDGDGFVLYFKRLEKGHFRWPGLLDDIEVMELSTRELTDMLSMTKLERRFARDEVWERALY